MSSQQRRRRFHNFNSSVVILF
ncbi:hypothetical protein D046_3821A, partial [Vibrio parahaemolyticus V-223/04]